MTPYNWWSQKCAVRFSAAVMAVTQEEPAGVTDREGSGDVTVVALWAGVSPKLFSTLTVTREQADGDHRTDVIETADRVQEAVHPTARRSEADVRVRDRGCDQRGQRDHR